MGQNRNHKGYQKIFQTERELKTHYIKTYWMQCLEGKNIPLNSYIENEGLQTVIYKLLHKEYQKKSK